MSYVLPERRGAYEAGTVLTDMTLAEARALECNRCGGCCAGDLDDETVRKDKATGLPLMVWESPDTAAHPQRAQTADPMRYASRFDGDPLLIPLVMVDGGIGFGEDFERDADGRPYTAYHCRALAYRGRGAEPESECRIYGTEQHQVRPYNCGAFPVYGLEVDDAIVQRGYYIPPTGALPRCTWYGIRITGPWKDRPAWRARYAAQARGEPVQDMSLPPAFVAAVAAQQRKQ